MLELCVLDVFRFLGFLVPVIEHKVVSSADESMGCSAAKKLQSYSRNNYLRKFRLRNFRYTNEIASSSNRCRQVMSSSNRCRQVVGVVK